MDAPAQRRELRQQLAERRRALTPLERITAAQGLRRTLEQLPEYFTDARVAGYWASNGELPLNVVIPPLAAREQQFLLPVVGTDRQLRFAPWQAGDAVQPNRHGIPEPVAPATWFAPFQLDLVLVPLLGFDRRGHRLGYGGGYYDRTLARLTRPARLVGFAFAAQELPTIPRAPHDRPLDAVVTEKGVRHFASAGSQA